MIGLAVVGGFGFWLCNQLNARNRSDTGTDVAVLFYSLIESARLNDKDPQLYLQRAADSGLELCARRRDEKPRQLGHAIVAQPTTVPLVAATIVVDRFGPSRRIAQLPSRDLPASTSQNRRFTDSPGLRF